MALVKVYTEIHNREGSLTFLHVLRDLTPIEKVWNIMKKESGKLSNNKKKKALENTCNLRYGIHRETVKELYDKMPSMVEAVRKAKGDSTMY